MTIFKGLIILLLIFISVEAYALRVSRPPTLVYPLDEQQVADLNNYLRDIWDITNGRIELDNGNSKTNAKNNEVWMVTTGSTTFIQYRAGNHVYTIRPDGF